MLPCCFSSVSVNGGKNSSHKLGIIFLKCKSNYNLHYTHKTSLTIIPSILPQTIHKRHFCSLSLSAASDQTHYSRIVSYRTVTVGAGSAVAMVAIGMHLPPYFFCHNTLFFKRYCVVRHVGYTLNWRFQMML